MRANVWSLGLAIAIFAVATIGWINPYNEVTHRWEVTLAVALVSLFLLVQALPSVALSWGQAGFAALGALGGVVIAIAFIAAELLVGPPQRIGAAPGQIYRPLHSGQLALAYPSVSARDLRSGVSAASVVVVTGARSQTLPLGEEVRVRSYVLRAQRWPAVYVEAWSLHKVAQTVTQPQGSAFVSPVLQFPNLDSEDNLPIDNFAVPALHRDVHIKFYPSLPSKGINIPFVQIAIDEENGGALFSGVAVNARPIKAAGMELVFNLGTYPVVWLAGAPDRFPYMIGALMIAAGLMGFVASTIRTRDAAAKSD